MTLSPVDRARRLVLRYGWNTTCYQILNPGFELWFAADADAVVGYVEHHNTCIVGGAPVCGHDRLAQVSAEFERAARDRGCRTCYFGAESRLEEVFRENDRYSMILLGGQPVWNPHVWPERLSHHASLRAQLNRARNKNVRVREWPAERARDHKVLQRSLDEWLAARGLPPLHFLIETDTLSRVFDRRVFVAEREGEVVGFLVASPVPTRSGWLVEQLVRGRGAVNGTSELLIDAAMRAMTADGAEFVTLGLAPLSTHTGRTHHSNPIWLKLLLEWLRVHGRRFYNFRGLEAFKAKFDPERWEPVYAIVNESSFGFRTLYAVAAAFAEGSPVGLIARAVGHAAVREMQAVHRRVQ